MKELVENNKELFKGQEFFIGMDTHKKFFKIGIQNNGRMLKKFSMKPESKELFNHMQKNYPGGTYNCVYEAGSGGFWLHRELKKYGFKSIVVNPADVPSTEKERSRKSDKVDCRKLSRELANGSLTGIYIPSEQEESLRNISRLRFQIVKENTRTKNRIKSFLSLFNIKLPENSEERHWSKNFINRIKNIEFSKEYNRVVRDNLIMELEHQRERNRQILKTIREISSEIEDIKYIKSVPGVGEVIAFSLYAELYRMDRFKRLDELCSIIGLVPSVSQSGESEYNLGLTKRSNHILRSLMIEAAWMAIRQDPALTSAYNEYCKRMNKQMAIIRIARKLVSRIRYVWLNQKEYVPGVIK